MATVIDANLSDRALAVLSTRQEQQMAKNAANNLIAEVRTETGKGASRRARRDGPVPAVLNGPGTAPHQLNHQPPAISAVLRHAGTNAVLTLDIEGKEQLALTKALVIHPIRRSITHVDLVVLRRGEKVTVEVNVVIEGEAVPGTLVTQDSNTITIEADALSIPQQLTVSVDGADIGTQFTAGAIELPEGVSLVSDADMLVVNVVAAPTAEDLEAEGAGEAEEAAEPAEAAASAGDGEGGGEASEEAPAAESE
jgi:large subunit ribosomal protein L25